MEGNYIDGKEDGVFQLKSTVYEGVVFEEETYKNGKLDGESKRWVFIPKETDSPREYRILVSKAFYEAPAEPKPGVPGKRLKSISFDFGNYNEKIEKASGGCGDITLSIDDSTQGNEHYYKVVLHSLTLHKRYIERDFYAQDYDYTHHQYETDKEYCISQYGFFETLLERFEKGEFNPFSNDSDYQIGKPIRGKSFIAFQSEKFKGKQLKSAKVSETIIETINDGTYKLVISGRGGGYHLQKMALRLTLASTTKKNLTPFSIKCITKNSQASSPKISQN